MACADYGGKRYLNLNGISWTLDGDIDRAVSVRPLAQKMMHVMKMQNVNNLDHVWYTHRMEDGTVIRVESLFGRDKAYVYCTPIGAARKKDIKKKKYAWPVLGIDMWSPVGKFYCTVYQDVTDPIEDGVYFYMNGRDKQWGEDEDGQVNYTSYGDQTHYRLEHVGKTDTQDTPYTYRDVYEPLEDDKIFWHEIAYRTLYAPNAHVYYHVRPLIVTCGEYEAQTPLDFEFYTDMARAKYWDTYKDYKIYVNGEVVKTASFRTRSEYEITRIEEVGTNDTLTLPDELFDFWTPDEYNSWIGDICYEPGVYELWERGTYENKSYSSGEQVHWQDGEYSESLGVGAFIYAYYNYPEEHMRDEGIYYEYKLILWVNGEEHTLVEGERTPSSTYMIDDIYVEECEIYDFNGSPVVVFGFIRYYWDRDPEAETTYGIWYAGNLYMTQNFPGISTSDYRHDVDNAYADRGLLGYAEVSAMGIEQEKIIEE